VLVWDRVRDWGRDKEREREWDRDRVSESERVCVFVSVREREILRVETNSYKTLNF